MDLDSTRSAPLTASGWYARLRASDCSPEDRAAFEAWRTVPANAAAFAAVEHLARGVDRALAAGPRLYPQVIRAVAPATSSPQVRLLLPRWRRLLPGIAASAVALLGGAAWVATAIGRSATPVEELANEDTRQQRHRLDDGSIVWLDAGTRIAVRFGGRERAVELREGRALFEVADDGARAFIVDAAGSRTVVRDTRFQVERDAGSVRITLAEGSLAVSGAGPAGRSWEAQLAPGEQLRWAGAGAAASKHRVDVDRATRWSGRLARTGISPGQAALQRDRQRILSNAELSYRAISAGAAYVARNDTSKPKQADATWDAGLPLWADLSDG